MYITDLNFDYLAELQQLTDYCEFGDHLQEVLYLITRMVCGLQSEATLKLLLTHGSSNSECKVPPEPRVDH